MSQGSSPSVETVNPGMTGEQTKLFDSLSGRVNAMFGTSATANPTLGTTTSDLTNIYKPTNDYISNILSGNLPKGTVDAISNPIMKQAEIAGNTMSGRFQNAGMGLSSAAVGEQGNILSDANTSIANALSNTLLGLQTPALSASANMAGNMAGNRLSLEGLGLTAGNQGFQNTSTLMQILSGLFGALPGNNTVVRPGQASGWDALVGGIGTGIGTGASAALLA